MTKIKFCCPHCGSENVVRDAWVEWDTDTQDWELVSVYDDNYCTDCERVNVVLIKKEIKEPKP